MGQGVKTFVYGIKCFCLGLFSTSNQSIRVLGIMNLSSISYQPGGPSPSIAKARLRGRAPSYLLGYEPDSSMNSLTLTSSNPLRINNQSRLIKLPLRRNFHVEFLQQRRLNLDLSIGLQA